MQDLARMAHAQISIQLASSSPGPLNFATYIETLYERDDLETRLLDVLILGTIISSV